MRLVLRAFAVLAILGMTVSAPAFAGPLAGKQDTKKPDDVIQKKDGGILVGRILKVEGDHLEVMVTGEKETRRILLKDLNPYSVYRIRLDRIDKNSGQAHLDLAEFCMTNGLYSTAVREFDEAARLDKTLEEKAKKRREEAHNEDGRAKFEETKKLAAEKKYEEANKICQILIEKYADTPYALEAKNLVIKIAEDVAKENELKKKQLEDNKDKKEQKLAVLKENQEADIFTRTGELIEDAQKLWLEGLDHEPKNLTKAERAWKSSEIALLTARRNLEFLLKSNNVDTLKKAKELDKQVDAVLVKTYYRLGRMWAVELSYPTALEWLNKGIKVPHDDMMDRMLNELLLTISQLKMRERAAGRGY